MSTNPDIDILAEDIANGAYDDHLSTISSLVRNRKAALQLMRLKGITSGTVIVTSSTMDPYYMRDKRCRVDIVSNRRDGSKKYTVTPIDPVINTAGRRYSSLGLYAEHIGRVLPNEGSDGLQAVQ